MVAITNFLLFATTVCATVLPRQASVINADLNAINKNVTALHDSVNAYNGDLSAAITIQQNTNDLQSGIQAATKRVNSSPDIGPKGSKSIVAYISNTLSPNIGDTLNALVGKESTFSSAGLSSLVENDLKSLQVCVMLSVVSTPTR